MSTANARTCPAACRDTCCDWGQLQPGATAALREGARAYAGDLIIARQNDNQDAGEPGRTLANGDLLRVEAIGETDMTVSRHDQDRAGAASLNGRHRSRLSRDYAPPAATWGMR